MTKRLLTGVAAVVSMSDFFPRRPILQLRRRYLSLRQLRFPVPALERQCLLLRPRTGFSRRTCRPSVSATSRAFHLVELSDGSGNEVREPDALYE